VKGKCEGMNPHTPKGTSTLGVWSFGGFPNLQRAIVREKSIELKSFLYD
jgi:hypothetical protein